MKKYVLALTIAAAAMSVMVSTAEAKRLGGGGSFGRQSQNVTRQAAPAQARPAPAPAAPAAAPGSVTPPKPASPWRGILGGALLGLGLGALFSHFGLGGALGSIIGSVLMIALLGLAAMFIYRMFRRKTDDGAMSRTAFAGGPNNFNAPTAPTPEIGSRLPVSLEKKSDIDAAALSGATIVAPWGVPVDFDVQGFLRIAKTNFIRLQAAWDKGDINDIREFTTSEMFAEFRLELQERGTATNHTDVVSLDADMLGIETVGDHYSASVKFSGMIKESENEAAAPFAEVWNLSKPTNGSMGWTLAGIQQLA